MGSSNAYLRRSVRVGIDKDDSSRIDHPCFSAVLDSTLFNVDTKLLPFLNGELAFDDFSPKTQEGKDLKEFFESMHSFRLEKQKATYTSEEVIEICRANFNEWYGYLYSHPIWEKLRGKKDTVLLRRWIIQNHFLSKSASASAAIAYRIHKPLRDFFYKSIVEEYSHYQDFFQTKSVVLGIDDESFQKPQAMGIEVFNAHMCRMAEENVLGVLMFYYFQEASAAFHREFRSFYGDLENEYNVPEYFSPWLEHVDYDEEHDHAVDVEEALQMHGTVTHDELVVGLQGAWVALASILADYNLLTQENEEASYEPYTPSQTARTYSAMREMGNFVPSSSVVELGKLLKQNNQICDAANNDTNVMPMLERSIVYYLLEHAGTRGREIFSNESNVTKDIMSKLGNFIFQFQGLPEINVMEGSENLVRSL